MVEMLSSVILCLPFDVGLSVSGLSGGSIWGRPVALAVQETFPISFFRCRKSTCPFHLQLHRAH